MRSLAVLTAGRCRTGFVALLGILACVAMAGAEQIESIPNPRARDNTWVTDTTGTLRPETIARLNTRISEFESLSGAELAVVVIQSLDGAPIEDFAERLFRHWGIGKRDKDNGVLLLWATGDRRVRIEVGYGLEGILPDGKVGAILDAYVIPHFKHGAWDEGVEAGVDAVVKVISGDTVAIPSAASDSYEHRSLWPFVLGLGGLAPASLGSFLGYRRWRRYRRRKCPECGAVMKRLDEVDDDAFLEEGQRTEERLGSVDYDVWNCPSCPQRFVLRYPKWFTSFQKCPQCRNRTCAKREETIRAATTSSSGEAKVTETCEFCSYRRVYTRTIPRVSSSSGGGSSRGGSFGGGRSGGGGASRSY